MYRRCAIYSFLKAELDLFRAGAEAYLTMAAKTLTHQMNAKGGSGYYEFECSRVSCDGLDTHQITATELRMRRQP